MVSGAYCHLSRLANARQQKLETISHRDLPSSQKAARIVFISLSASKQNFIDWSRLEGLPTLQGFLFLEQAFSPNSGVPTTPSTRDWSDAEE